MSSANHAVFLSYASQDAEAARRIAEALRGFGVEVWFDQNELRGGDQWDNNIRSQIKACSLFVPVISATTQSRDEAYFRLEWKLADDRSHLMAPGKPFIVPVVIDDTPDYGASVPDSFTKAQWTRLPGGDPSTAFIDQVKRLTAPGTASAVAGVADPGASRQQPGSATPATAPTPPKKRSPALTYGAATAILIGIVAAVLVNRSSDSSVDSSAKASAEAKASAQEEPALSAGALAQEDTAGATTPAKSIAVLPFENRSADANDVFFTDGIHDDLITQVSRIEDIKTIARSSVMGYRETTKQLAQIGEELGVATVLQGGVQRAGNRVRINVQLSDAATDDHLWSQTYTRELTAENIFEIQTEIATAVAQALQAVLSPTEQQLLDTLPTENLAALEAYFKGKQELEKYTSEGLAAAIPHYEEAIRLDPTYADAYAGLARTLMHQNYFSGMSRATQWALAKPHLEKAMELNPNLPDVWVELGNFLSHDDNDGAEAAFQRAIELGPNTVNAYKGYGAFLQWSLGDLDKSIDILRQAVEVDPRDQGALNMLAAVLVANFEREEAEAILEKSIHANSERSTAYSSLGVLYYDGFKRYDEALKAFRQALALDPGNLGFVRDIAWTYFAMGNRESWDAWMQVSMDRVDHGTEAWGAEAWLHKASYHKVHGEDLEARSAAERVPLDSWWGPRKASILFRTSRDQGERRAWLTELESEYPEFTDLTADLNPSFLFAHFIHLDMMFRLGETARVHQQARRILDAMPVKPAARWQYAEWIIAAHAFAGERTQAMQAWRDFVNQGGAFYREDRPVYENTFKLLEQEPGFDELMGIMAERLAAQRATVERWEANGELAPTPDPLENPL